MKLIGLSGKMGSGKSTIVQCLKDITLEEKVLVVKLAGPLYDIQEYVYRRISQVHQRPESFIKDRKLLQWIGSEWGRDTIGTNLWVDLFRFEVLALHKKYPHAIIVCDDVRFDNEAEAIKDLGGKVVKVTSTLNEKRIDMAAGISNHQSEAGINLDYVDYIIENNGSKDELRESLYVLNSQYGLW